MDELLPIEIRIRRLVEGFFASEISGNEFKLELARMRQEYEPREKKHRKAKRKGTAKHLRVPKEDSSQSRHLLH